MVIGRHWAYSLRHWRALELEHSCRLAYQRLVGIQHLSAHITADEAVEMDQALHAMVYAQLQGHP